MRWFPAWLRLRTRKLQACCLHLLAAHLYMQPTPHNGVCVLRLACDTARELPVAVEVVAPSGCGFPAHQLKTVFCQRRPAPGGNRDRAGPCRGRCVHGAYWHWQAGHDQQHGDECEGAECHIYHTCRQLPSCALTRHYNTSVVPDMGTRFVRRPWRWCGRR